MDMDFTGSRRLLLVVMMVASLWGMSMANKDWGPYHPPNQTEGPNKINVGGSENWRFGFNYTEWAFQNGPFYINDTLVFKYDPPSNTTFPHDVYLLPNLWSFLTCDFRRAKMIANSTQGSGEGFQFVLNRWRPYYFACSVRNGFHCKVGRMKFMVVPFFRWHR
ncbi:uncharacterized protein LOC111298710 [Durio zibethinus]|uniref:Uncharacterized protein LOC111298710 n=1 Tax=Durio zibethinus TaxID=66656 RepID=A0A6P5Z9K3_DURZI|nr:uncharacterized protein LOC111298710 [Durio zibethinus]